MTKRHIKQRELPLLADVKSGVMSNKSVVLNPEKPQLSRSDFGFHKPASKEDQSIYQSISDGYFKKQN